MCSFSKLILFLAVCKELTPPDQADMDCSDGNSFGSECEFTCNVGYTRVGSDFSVCTQTSDSEGVAWSHPVPACQPAGKNRMFRYLE